MDVNTLAVALISVGGALGGTLGGAVLSQRAGRAQAQEQTQRADREREEGRAEQALQAKRELYARLNTAARAYRVAARDAVEAAERGESVDPAFLDAAKDAWAEQYSQAQMALANEVLQVASALNRSLGVGYAVVRQLPSSPRPDEAYQRAMRWFSDPLSDGVYLLRVTLRHDLGVEVDPHFEQTRLQMLAALDGARDSLAYALAADRAPAA
uniref:Secreted protein n=1 Tax=Streptomyces sp. NBC_00049 TaxID=2903617 RepID=A0AAU2JVZ0_9ACTN